MENGESTFIYKCTNCDSVFESLDGIGAHQCEQRLPQNDIFKCSGCFRLFPNLDVFNAHECNTIETETNVDIPTSFKSEEEHTLQHHYAPPGKEQYAQVQHFPEIDPLTKGAPFPTGEPIPNVTSFQGGSSSVVISSDGRDFSAPMQLLQTECSETNQRQDSISAVVHQNNIIRNGAHIYSDLPVISTYSSVQHSNWSSGNSQQDNINSVAAETTLNDSSFQFKISPPGNVSTTDVKNLSDVPPTFKCSICPDEHFSSDKRLRYHSDRHKAKNFKYCTICSRSFRNQACLHFHLNLVHHQKCIGKDERKKSCQGEIKQSMLTISEMEDKSKLANMLHITSGARTKSLRTPSNKLNFKCNQCLKSFPSATSKRNHVDRVHGCLTYQCKHCLKSFQSSISHTQHQMNCQRRKYVCDESKCTKIFHSKLALAFHIRSHLGIELSSSKSIHKCRYYACARKFVSRRRLEYHYSTHRFPLKCNRCDLGLIGRQALQHHQQHSKCHKTYPCQYCHKTFKNNHSSVKHMKVFHPFSAAGRKDDKFDKANDDSENPADYVLPMSVDPHMLLFHCECCYDVFTSHIDLVFHLDRVDNHTLFCRLCLSDFKTEQDLGMHLKFAHANYKKRKYMKKLNSVEAARSKAKSEDPMNGHVQPANAKKPICIRQNWCKECSVEFKTPEDLDMHIVNIHNVDNIVNVHSLECSATGLPPYRPVPDPAAKQRVPRQPKSSPQATTSSAASDKPVMVTVAQIGECIPISKGPFFVRVLNLDVPARIRGVGFAKSRKLIHQNIFKLRCQIEGGATAVIENDREFKKSHTELFEEILLVPGIQNSLLELMKSADGCSVTFAVPFPVYSSGHVYVNFKISFGCAAGPSTGR